MSTAIRRDVPYRGPLIVDGGDGDVPENPVPLKPHNGPDVHHGRTATRQAGPEVHRGRTPMRQAGPDVHRSQTPLRQAFYAQPGNFIPSMIGKISGARGFRAFILSDPMEEDVIFRDFIRNTSSWDRADIRYYRPFWVSSASLYFLFRLAVPES